MEKKNLKPLIISSLAALAMVGVGTGATFALFTDKAESTIVVEAGTVDIETSLKKTTFYSAVADKEGTLVDENQAHYKHEEQTNGFINGGTVEIDGSNIVLTNITPGDKAVIRIKLDNKSTVKTKYRLVYGTGEGDSKLLAGLKGSISEVTLNGEQEVLTEIASLSGTTRFTSAWEAADAVAKNSSKTIKELELVLELPIDAGNVYQGKSAHINFSAEAVQSNASLSAENVTRTDSVRIDEHGEALTTVSLTGEGDVELPNLANDASVEKVVIKGAVTSLEGKKLLNGTTHLKEVELPDSIETIGDRVFYGSSVETIKLPAALTELGPSVFQQAASLRGPVTIPAGVQTLAATFHEATKLDKVIFAEGSLLKTVGQDTFRGTSITSISFPEHLESIGKWCFRDAAIEKVYFAGDAPEIDANAFLKAVGPAKTVKLFFKDADTRDAAIEKYKTANGQASVATDANGTYAKQSGANVYFLVGESTVVATDDALADNAKKDNAEVNVSVGEYALPTEVGKGATISGAGASATVMKTDGKQLVGENVTYSDMTMKGIVNNNAGGKSVACVPANTTTSFKDVEFVSNPVQHTTWDANIYVNGGSVALDGVKMDYSKANFRGLLLEGGSQENRLNVTVVNSEIDAVYPINGNGSCADIYVKDSIFHGWTSYGGENTAKFEKVTFTKGHSGYNNIAAYADTELKDCTFGADFHLYAQTAGFNWKLDNCYKDGVLVTADNFKDLFDDPDVWNKCTCTVNGVVVAQD